MLNWINNLIIKFDICNSWKFCQRKTFENLTKSFPRTKSASTLKFITPSWLSLGIRSGQHRQRYGATFFRRQIQMRLCFPLCWLFRPKSRRLVRVCLAETARFRCRIKYFKCNRIGTRGRRLRQIFVTSDVQGCASVGIIISSLPCPNVHIRVVHSSILSPCPLRTLHISNRKIKSFLLPIAVRSLAADIEHPMRTSNRFRIY